jgi:hypothetical protein
VWTGEPRLPRLASEDTIDDESEHPCSGIKDSCDEFASSGLLRPPYVNPTTFLVTQRSPLPSRFGPTSEAAEKHQRCLDLSLSHQKPMCDALGQCVHSFIEEGELHRGQFVGGEGVTPRSPTTAMVGQRV